MRYRLYLWSRAVCATQVGAAASGAAVTRASLHPLRFQEGDLEQSSGAARREIEDSYPVLACNVKSEKARSSQPIANFLLAEPHCFYRSRLIQPDHIRRTAEVR